MKANALVAQSGGPSPVINASLQGVVEACLKSPDINTVYAAHHGIEGVLLEHLIDMNRQEWSEIKRLQTSPAAAAGSCRYKLKDGYERDYQRILDVFKAHDIHYFFYIGGNDSMDTAHKVASLSKAQGYDLFVMGVPKTIDNDLGDEARTLIDHTPGYGSCARYWANIIKSVEEENRAMHPSECVSVLQAMGRDSGFITAAARLGDPGREMPLLLFLPEAGHTAEAVCDLVTDGLKRWGRVIAVVSESLMADQSHAKVDGFGHVEYGASKTTAMQTVVNLLNSKKLPVRGQATGQVPGILQRSCALDASEVDREEAYTLGHRAVEYALQGVSGQMATILRVSNQPYTVRYDHVPLQKVANAARKLPGQWIAPGGTDVTDGFINYTRPLIGRLGARFEAEDGLLRFARLKYDYVEKKLPAYTPLGFE
ncbi:MAG: diphosphate--fructose-6-phosphate 1-phosphotransferase [Clostridiales bacterium]|jgi:6-phosphofructokinase 1|nr:diphosphate--fructose-6-phosphate 1-phosphotransferase [Clostridiales bacterium]